MDELTVVEIIIWIVAFAFGILQIILFFKVWKMTEDVNGIRSILTKEEEPESLDPVFFMWAVSGDKEKAKELLYPIIINSPEFKQYATAGNEQFKQNCLEKLNKRFEIELKSIDVQLDYLKLSDLYNAKRNAAIGRYK